MGVLHVPLHIYSALVIPVLLGVSVDEAMFLLHHARDPGGDPIARTLDRETRPVVTTALTTSAGLVALVFAQYDGLRHLGIVGAVGNVANLLTALLLVPAGLRLTRSWRRT
jgi:predicted RND superfamily exporter protein